MQNLFHSFTHLMEQSPNLNHHPRPTPDLQLPT